MNPTQSKKNSNKRNSQRDSQKNSQKNSQRSSQRNNQNSNQSSSQSNRRNGSSSSNNNGVEAASSSSGLVAVKREKSVEEKDLSALTRKLLDNRAVSTSPTGSADKKMQDDLLAQVKKNRGERTPSNSQNSQHDVDLPPDYYITSVPHVIGTPGGVSPRHGKAGISSNGDDESQGVRWGSEDEDDGVRMSSDDEE